MIRNTILSRVAMVALALLPILPAQAETPAARSTTLADQLVGTWKVVAVEDRKDPGDPHSAWTHPYGPNPTGYIVYDATGHVSVHVMRTPPAPRFRSDEQPTRDELMAVREGYAGYFGTYTVDEGGGTVTHHVEGGSLPEYTGTDQVRPIRIDGNRLEIGDGRTWRRILQRQH